MNREGIRCLAAETLGLPTWVRILPTVLTMYAKRRHDGWGSRIVKPVMSSSGKGSRLRTSEDGLTPHGTTALNAGRAGTADA